MKNITKLLCATLIILICNSCGYHYLAPTLYKNDVAYMFKPISSDSAKSANYISGSGYFGFAGDNDNVVLGQLNLSRAHAFDETNLAYGVFGFYGDYQNTTIGRDEKGYFSDRLTYGYGARFSYNSYIKYHSMDFRFFGIDAVYSKEFGPYADFRTSVKNAPGIYTDASTSLLTAGFTNEMIFHNSDATMPFRGGYHVFVGGVFGNHSYTNNHDADLTNAPIFSPGAVLFALSGFMQFRNYTYTLETQNLSSIRLSLGYRF